jgi:hypothetical protein
MSNPLNRCLVFFSRSPFGLQDAAHALSKAGLSVAPSRSALKVSWHSGPVLTVTVLHGQAARAEATCLPRHPVHSHEIEAATGLLRISFTDRNAVLDDANTLIETQLTLQAVTAGVLYTAWNHQFSAYEP